MAEPIEILVVGDWVVDENWVLAKHRSSFSTMEGKAHLRALGTVNSRVMTFCGAGRVARFLYWMNRFREPAESTGNIWIPPEERSGCFSIFGIGTWADVDEPKVYRMFHPRYLDGLNPFTLRRIKQQHIHFQELDGLYLQNLAPAYAEAVKNGTWKESTWKEIGTPRVYRLYNLQAETRGGLVLDRRVDFELRYQSLPKQPGARVYDEAMLQELLRGIPALPAAPEGLAFASWKRHLLRDLETLRLRALHELNPQCSEGVAETLEKMIKDLCHPAPAVDPAIKSRSPFRYVVVKDLGKGTTTSALLEALYKERLVDEHTRWFVSSKKFRPDYLTELAKRKEFGSLRLLFLPPMAIAQMEREGIAPPGHGEGRSRAIYKWFVGEAQPTAESLERLEDFLAEHEVSAPHPHQHGARRGPLLVVAMPKGLSLLAVEGHGEKRDGYYQPKTILDEISEELSGRASMFFSALVSQIILADAGDGPVSAGENTLRTDEMLEVALKAAYDVVLVSSPA